MSKALSDDVLEQLERSGLYAESDGRVGWLDDATQHPKNWPVRWKLFDTGVITLFVTVSWVFRTDRPPGQAC